MLYAAKAKTQQFTRCQANLALIIRKNEGYYTYRWPNHES